MFSYEDTIVALEDFETLKDSKAQKFLRNLLQDDSFKEFLFNPPTKKYENLSQMTNKLYERLVKPKVMKGLIKVIEDEGYDEFDRTTAAFLTGVVNLAVAANNDRLAEISSMRKNVEVSEKNAEKLREKLIANNDIILKLQKCARKIVKRWAKKIEDEVGLDRDLISIALYSVPDPKYINQFKVGFFLNNFLNLLYAELDKAEYSDTRIDKVNWQALFKEVYGKQNVVEAATFILLEGVRRIDPFKSRTVKECWESLTPFALKELETAPEALRTHMLDLYIKRIDKMFANHACDLRVDMRSIDELAFPNLVKTLKDYKDKITEIVTRTNPNH